MTRDRLVTRWYSRPEVLLVGTFLGLIAVGAVLLSLPQATPAGEERLAPLDAVFMATSAVCVTGLSTISGGSASLSRFGQTVVIVLVQIGGLGVMTFGVLGMQLLRRRLSFSSQAAVETALFQARVKGGFRGTFWRIVLVVFACELLGTLMLWFDIAQYDADLGRSLFDAAFMAISAFCNAGFSVYADSVMRFNDDPLFLITVMSLIFVGGVGHVVLIELLGRVKSFVLRRPPPKLRLTLHSRVVLRSSLLLIGGGAAALLLIDVGWGGATWWQIAPHALFQSVTARTAGFNTVDIGALPIPAMLVLIALMFVGGAPASCAGGIKTTSLAVWVGRVRGGLTGRSETRVLDRVVPPEVTRRAAQVIAIAALWNFVGVMVLATSETMANPELGLQDVVFEQVSAFATVGLSTGLTTELSMVGKVWITLSMFVGRLGPLTIAVAVLRTPHTYVTYPNEGVMIG